MKIIFAMLTLFCLAATAADDPCRTIELACLNAGYLPPPADTPAKNLFVDCIKPIMRGMRVVGVDVNPEVVTACRQKRPAMSGAKKFSKKVQ
jgi:hypothetical protein